MNEEQQGNERAVYGENLILILAEKLKSRGTEGLLRLANQGLRPQQPSDIIKNPVVIEFLGLPELEKLVESDFENALGSQIQLPTDEQLIAEMKRELRELS